MRTTLYLWLHSGQRTPSAAQGYNPSNKLRVEPAVEAAGIDHRIEDAWRDHPRRFFVQSHPDFLVKATEELRRLRDELPVCCRGRLDAAPLAAASSCRR